MLSFLLTTIFLLPVFSSFTLLLFGRFFSRKSTALFVLSNMIVCLFSSLYAVFLVVFKNVTGDFVLFFNWVTLGTFDVSFGFLFDSLSVLMVLLVVFVSTLVHYYSVEYMYEDPHIIRFLSYLSLFTFFMLVFVVSPNYLQMFIGWEGVGLSSYLLINFWYTRLNANKSAMKAIIVNRISDSFLYFGILLLFLFFQTLDISTLFNLIPFSPDTFAVFYYLYDITAIALCFFIGAMGKSAQIGLHTWLPDAMEGPTPVSALIHAATMVTAGVYLIIRSSFLFMKCPGLLLFVLFIGSLTAIFAGSIGCFQNDIKKIIAYSTCSQLGYMVFVCGLSNFSLSFFHLFNHGFFKALLFLGAGSVIHSVCDEQDIRKMGSLHELLPLSYVSFLVGSIALMGFPFLTGFYSKDLILELAFCNISIAGLFAYWLGVIAAFFTAFYSFRLIYYVFFGAVNASSPRSYVYETEDEMFIALVILCFFSIIIGFLFKDIFIGLGSPVFDRVLYQSADSADFLFLAEFWMASFHKNIPFLFSLLGSFLGFFAIKYARVLSFWYVWRKLFWFFSFKWMFDPIYNLIVVRFFMSFCYNITYKLIDKGIIEFFGSFSLANIISTFSRSVSLLQTGFIHHYIFTMFIMLCFYLLFFYISSFMFFLVTVSFFVFYLFKSIEIKENKE